MKKTVSARLTMAGLLLAASILAGLGQGHAGELGFESISGPGYGGSFGGVISTLSPNNDNTTSASTNTVTQSKTSNAVGVIDQVFRVADSGIGAPGTTEYFFSETLTNNTGVAWSDFHMVLGFGTGANFVTSSLGDNLDFDTDQKDPTPTSSLFATLSHGAKELGWSGGPVPDGGSVTFTFSVDVPDSASCSGTTPACGTFNDSGFTGYFFTLREFPTTDETPPPTGVPFPGSLVLFGFGLAALGTVGLRRARTSR